jgi:hypothetical protein
LRDRIWWGAGTNATAEWAAKLGMNLQSSTLKIDEAFGMRLEAQEAGRVRKHRRRIGLGEAFAAQHLEEDFRMAPRHVGIGHALRRHVAEIAEAIDHLLGRPARDAELQATASDEVGAARVLRHVERVLVAHVDDRGANLDALRPRADRGQERERRG